MTEREQYLAKQLKDFDSVTLEPYISVNRKNYFKCKAADGRALNLITPFTVDLLVNKGHCAEHPEKRRHYILNITSLNNAVKQWLDGIAERVAKKKQREQKKRQKEATNPLNPF